MQKNEVISTPLTIGQLILTEAYRTNENYKKNIEQDAILHDFCDFVDSTGFDILDLCVFLNSRNLEIHQLLLRNETTNFKSTKG